MSNVLYKVNVGDKPMASDLDQLIDALNGAFDVGNVSLAAPISAPDASGVTAAIETGTSLGVGAYSYKLTYVVGYKKSNGTFVFGGETNASAAIDVTTASGDQNVTLNGLPTSWTSTAVGLRIYRTSVGGSSYNLVTTLTAPNASYSDTTADSALGSAIPTSNTTGTRLILASDPSQALEAATKQYVDNAQSAAETYAVAKTGDTMTGILNLLMAGRQFNVNNWGDVSANDSGWLMIANNAYLQNGDASLRYSNTHASLGARGIIFKNTGDETTSIELFDTGSVATTKDAVFTPTFHKFAQTDVDNAFSIGQTITGPITQNHATASMNFIRSGYTVKQAGDWYVANNANSTVLLSVTDAGVVKVLGNQVWDQGSLRWNVDHLEYNDSGTWKAVGGVKSVQRGVWSCPGEVSAIDIAISSVDLSKATVNFPNTSTSPASTDHVGYAELTSSTNLHIQGNAIGTYSWEVIEYN